MPEPEIILIPRYLKLFNNFRECNLLSYLVIIFLRRSKNFVIEILRK